MTASSFVYVGTYTEPIRFGTGQILQGQGRGIHIFRFADGRLEPCGLAAGVRNPSYLAFHPNRRFLYAVNEFKEFNGAASGAISAFAIDPVSGDLTFLNQKATHGTDPCHLIVHPDGRHVYVANFASGSVCILPIASDGSLEEASQVVQHQGSSVDPVRQAGPHAHAVELDAAGRFAFVPDLGLDAVLVYRIADGHLADPPLRVPTKAGAGPRQLVMHPTAPFAYLINELDSTMTAFAFDQATGALTPLQTLPTLPADFSGQSTCAEVQIAPDGRFLYGSNRGHDSLAIFAVDATNGTLTAHGHRSTGGRIPRNFSLSPDGAFVAAANQDTDNILMFRREADGRLTPTGQEVAVGTPVCVRFFG